MTNKSYQVIDVIEIKEKRHSATGASGYHRWKSDACPGSVKMIREKAPPDLLIPDEVRDEGIEAHAIAEAFLETPGSEERGALKTKLANAEDASFKMINDIQGYVDYVERLATLPEAILYVEQYFNLDWLWMEPVFDKFGKETGEYSSVLYGTSDAVVYAPFSKFLDLEQNKMYEGPCLHVIDLKYGFNTWEAEENPQALYYALGAYHMLRAQGKKINRIILHIYQPRATNRNSRILTWSCDEKYLEEFALNLQNDASIALDDDAPLNPSPESCRLCKARVNCTALIKSGYGAAHLQLINDGKDPSKELPPLEILMEDKAAQYKMALLASIWADSLKSRIRSEMNIQGVKYEGLKLVAGRNSRQLINLPQIEKDYPAEDFPGLYETPDLKSAAQCLEYLKTMEEKYGEEVFSKFKQQFVILKEGVPLVALKSDKKEEYNPLQKVTEEWKDEIATTYFEPATPPPPLLTYGTVLNLTKPPEALVYKTLSIFNK